jgi:hypothetical protein
MLSINNPQWSTTSDLGTAGNLCNDSTLSCGDASFGLWKYQIQAYEGPPLFVNGDVLVNIARLHTHPPLECSWYDSYQHWWCVRFERSAALLSVWTLLHQRMRCSHSPLCLQTRMAPGTRRL